MNTRMIAFAMGLSAVLSSGGVNAAESPHDPYYRAFYGVSQPMTPPRGATSTPMTGKAAYGAPMADKQRYAGAIRSGSNRNTLNRAGDAGMDRVHSGANGHRAYDRAFNPN